MKTRFGLTALFLIALACPAGSAEPAPATPADKLLKATEVHGGLALVVGAKDMALPRALAGGSSLYVQVLQPDAKLAGEWGAAVAGDALREQLGIRNAAFDPEHYGSNLLNLIVVEDPAALGGAKPADLDRILVPNGSVAFRAAPSGMADQAKQLGLTASSTESFQAIYRKPARPVEWKVCDSIRWRAGPRAANASAFSGIALGDGKLVYRERMELDRAQWPKSRSQLVVRDAYNGRVLWSIEEAPGWNPNWSARSNPSNGMAVDDTGRLFVTTDDGKFVCRDADTGEVKFSLVESGVNPGNRAMQSIRTYRDKLVIAGGSVFSAEDGKLLWTFDDGGSIIAGDRLIHRAGRWRDQLECRQLPDGKVLWTKPISKSQWLGLIATPKHVHVTQDRPKSSVTTFDIATGEQVWAREYDSSTYGRMGFLAYDGKLYGHYGKTGVKQDYFFAVISPATGEVEREGFGAPGKMWAGGCWGPFRVGDFLVYHHNIWLNLKTLDRTFPYLAHPACFTGATPDFGMLYNFPSRKGGVLQGVTAIGPADIAFDHEPGGKVLVKLGDAPADAPPTKPGDWPMFRASPVRGNYVTADVGDKPAKKWDVRIGLGKATYGEMSGQRTGLTQPVIAYGLAIVADIEAQRIVAVDVETGNQKWVRHVGARVDFSPAIYNGLCLFASRDGWVHCLDARTGEPVWKLLAAPQRRLIGGQEKLESLWPMTADVLVSNGVGYVSIGVGGALLGGIRTMAFKPESGEVVWSETYHGELSEIQDRQLRPGICIQSGDGPILSGSLSLDPKTGKSTRGGAGDGVLQPEAMDDYLSFGNSICRTNEDRAADLLSDGRVRGRTIAFSKDLGIAYTMSWGGESWDAKTNRGVPTTLTMSAAREPKKPLWTSDPIEMIMDDIVLTPGRAYCIGHYQRVDKGPELWVVSPEDGKVVSTIPVDAFPAFNGMSASGNRLLVSTRDGRLICYQGK